MSVTLSWDQLNVVEGDCFSVLWLVRDDLCLIALITPFWMVSFESGNYSRFLMEAALFRLSASQTCVKGLMFLLDRYLP